MAPKPKTCKYCKQKFIPERPKAICCSPDCAYDYGLKVKSRAEAIQSAQDRKTIKLRIDAIKPLSYWADKAQKAVNAFIRARDEGQPCISCGRHHAGKVNAGHYRSRGAMAALRYHHDNIHLQCEPCNTAKSGNQLEYRIRLIKKIGIEKVEWLEGNHLAPHWKKDDYLRIEAEHKQLLKELKNGY
jgi:hypothetical protein